MPDFDVDPPVIARAGARFTRQAADFTRAVNTFAAAAQIPASAAGPIGPGQDALEAYEDLFSHVTKHLHSLQEAVGETGERLSTSAANYEKLERANSLPGR